MNHAVKIRNLIGRLALMFLAIMSLSSCEEISVQPVSTASSKAKLSPLPADVINVQSYTGTANVSGLFVTELNPQMAVVGDVIQILGNDFDQYAPFLVMFHGQAVGQIIKVTDQMIEVKVPPGAESGKIMVQGSGATAYTPLFSIIP